MIQVFLLLLQLSRISHAHYDPEVTNVLNRLVEIDSRLDGQADINFQSTTSVKPDSTPPRLFTWVNSETISGPTYAAFINLTKFYEYPEVDIEERYTPAWEHSISTFLDTIVNTNVMNYAGEFLSQQGIISKYDPDSLKNLLHNLWFNPYARNMVVGSSGFESVFVGEVQDDHVIRLNNWLRFYNLESEGIINYRGLISGVPNVRLSARFDWNDWFDMETSMLLHSSPEFEMAAYTICALNGGMCEMTVNNEPVTIVAKVINIKGITMIDHCYPMASSFSETRTIQALIKPVIHRASDNELQALVDKMFSIDEDKPAPGDILFNWGNEVRGGKAKPQSKLITYVNETLFQRPIYSTYIKVLNSNLFTPDVCKSEPPMKEARKELIKQMFDTWTSTQVFNLAFKYLHNRGVKEAYDMETLKKYLWTLWFGTYSRCRGPSGSSGWEHVFVGEWKHGKVDGQHAWVKYYLLQAKDRITYSGYYDYIENLSATIQYSWQGKIKRKGGFLVGTSPVFDFSLFSVCSMMYPGNTACKYSINSYRLSVTSFKQRCDEGTCLATSYPVH